MHTFIQYTGKQNVASRVLTTRLRGVVPISAHRKMQSGLEMGEATAG